LHGANPSSGAHGLPFAVRFCSARKFSKAPLGPQLDLGGVVLRLAGGSLLPKVRLDRFRLVADRLGFVHALALGEASAGPARPA
jgi:hypothetical protein